MKFASSLLLLVATAVVCGCEVEGGNGVSLYIHPERIELESGGFITAERGVLHVPLNRARPDDGVVALQFHRFPRSESASPETPPIFQLRGGPGFGGLRGPFDDEMVKRIREFTDVSDLVFVGQRGIGTSRPDTVCEGPELPLDRVVPESEAASAYQEASSACKEFWEGEGVDLAGLNVLEAAADVDAVRAALGYERIMVWGGSFGSHWGIAVLRFHGDVVERAVLNAMEGPNHTYDMPGYVLNSLARMAEEADSAPELKAIVPEGGFIEGFERVVARAADAPIEVSVTDPESDESRTVVFDERGVKGLVFGYSGRVTSRRAMPAWPRDIAALVRGDFTTAAQTALRFAGRDFPTASFFMLDCGSGITAEREAQLNSDPGQAVVGNLGRLYQTNCPVWEADLGDAFRENFDTEIPTVIVHGTYDISTPLENAEELVPHFKNSRFVLVNGGSHGAIWEAMDHAEEFRAALMSYLSTGDMSALPDEVDLPPIAWLAP